MHVYWTNSKKMHFTHEMSMQYKISCENMQYESVLEIYNLLVILKRMERKKFIGLESKFMAFFMLCSKIFFAFRC